MTPPATVWILAAVTGPCVGSYVATAALRRAQGEQSTWGRSRCDGCRTALNLARTIPIVSYIQQRGAGFCCGARIDPTHPISEIAGGAILFSAIAASPTPRAVPLAAMGFLLLATAVYDSKTRKLPDPLTVLIALLGLILAGSRSMQSLLVGLVSAALAFVLIEGVRRLFLKLRRKAGLGFGDVKLIAALAIWTGVMTPWVVVVAALIGLATLLIRPPGDGKLAFGPCIAVSAWLVGLGVEAHLWPVLA